jgi:hypothetical protein
MNKRGSHVGIMLSFVLFVTAIIFLYDFISPAINFGEDKSQILESLESEIPLRFEGELINLKISLSEDCCEDSSCFFLSKDSSVKGMNSLVKDKNGNILESYSTEESIYVESPTDKFVNIFFTNESIDNTNEKLDDCESLEESTSAFTSKNYYFEGKIKNFSSEIKKTDSYERIKTELGIPIGTEFSFVFVYKNGSREGKEVSDVKTNILVDSVSAYYLNSTLDTNQGYFEIGVW